MTDEKIAADLTFRLTQSRRRERLLKTAQGVGEWWYFLLYAAIGATYFLIARSATDAYRPLLGMFGLIAIAEFRRLNNRINALTRLLDEELVPLHVSDNVTT